MLIVDLSENYGGASARVLTLMQNYPPERMFLAALEDSPVARYAMESSLPVLIVGRKKYDIRIFFNLVRSMRTYQFDLLDVQNIQSKFWGSLSASFSGVALVSTLNSWYFSEHQKTNLKGMIYIAIEFLTNWSTPHYIVVSQKIFDALHKAHIEPDRISLVYNAVDVKSKLDVSDKSDIRTRLNIPLGASICVALGRLVWAKGYENLIRAFDLLKSEKKNIFCVIIGSGELHSSLSEQITHSNLSDKVFLLGHQNHENALAILKACDIFVMPSRTEGTPIALLEAAFLGLPILASNVGGIPELVTEQDAFLIPVDDPAALANGILKLAKDREFAQALCKSARSRVTNFFSVERLLDATLQAYHKALC